MTYVQFIQNNTILTDLMIKMIIHCAFLHHHCHIQIHLPNSSPNAVDMMVPRQVTVILSDISHFMTWIC